MLGLAGLLAGCLSVFTSQRIAVLAFPRHLRSDLGLSNQCRRI